MVKDIEDVAEEYSYKDLGKADPMYQLGFVRGHKATIDGRTSDRLFSFILNENTPVSVHKVIDELLTPFGEWLCNSKEKPDYIILCRVEVTNIGALYTIFDDACTIEKIHDFRKQFLKVES